MKNLLKKIFLFFLSFLILISSYLTILAPSVHAQSTWYNSSFPEWYLKVYDESTSPPSEIFGERYTAAQVQWIIYSIPAVIFNSVLVNFSQLRTCIAQGLAGSAEISVCGQAIIDAAESIKQSLTGFNIQNTKGDVLANKDQSMIKQIFATERPLSGITYVRNVFKKLNPVSEIKAQSMGGYGFNVFLPISALWKISRNFAYFFFVIITIAFAFMIMFKVKLNPQTAITIQSALPKIIVALLLTTFSLAIAGFMVDLIYVIMGVFSVIWASAGGADIHILGIGRADIVFGFLNGPYGDVGLTLLIYFILYLIGYFITCILLLLNTFLLGIFSTGSLTGTIFSLLLTIFIIGVFFVLLWYLVKVTYVLFKNLAAVYGLVIVAPLQITAGALFPQGGFGSWLKKLFSKLIVFPLTGILIFLSFVFLFYSMVFSIQGIANNNILATAINSFAGLIGGSNPWHIQIGDLFAGSLWGPPLLGGTGSATAIAFLLMSVGLIIMIPKVSEVIEAFMAGKSLGPTGIGEALGPFGGIATQAGRTVVEAGTKGALPYAQRFGMQQTQNIMSRIPSDVRQKSKLLSKIDRGSSQWLEQNKEK